MQSHLLAKFLLERAHARDSKYHSMPSLGPASQMKVTQGSRPPESRSSYEDSDQPSRGKSSSLPRNNRGGLPGVAECEEEGGGAWGGKQRKQRPASAQPQRTRPEHGREGSMPKQADIGSKQIGCFSFSSQSKKPDLNLKERQPESDVWEPAKQQTSQQQEWLRLQQRSQQQRQQKQQESSANQQLHIGQKQRRHPYVNVAPQIPREQKQAHPYVVLEQPLQQQQQPNNPKCSPTSHSRGPNSKQVTQEPQSPTSVNVRTECQLDFKVKGLELKPQPLESQVSPGVHTSKENKEMLESNAQVDTPKAQYKGVKLRRAPQPIPHESQQRSLGDHQRDVMNTDNQRQQSRGTNAGYHENTPAKSEGKSTLSPKPEQLTPESNIELERDRKRGKLRRPPPDKHVRRVYEQAVPAPGISVTVLQENYRLSLPPEDNKQLQESLLQIQKEQEEAAASVASAQAAYREFYVPVNIQPGMTSLVPQRKGNPMTSFSPPPPVSPPPAPPVSLPQGGAGVNQFQGHQGHQHGNEAQQHMQHQAQGRNPHNQAIFQFPPVGIPHDHPHGHHHGHHHRPRVSGEDPMYDSGLCMCPPGSATHTDGTPVHPEWEEEFPPETREDPPASGEYPSGIGKSSGDNLEDQEFPPPPDFLLKGLPSQLLVPAESVYV